MNARMRHFFTPKSRVVMQRILQSPNSEYFLTIIHVLGRQQENNPEKFSLPKRTLAQSVNELLDPSKQVNLTGRGWQRFLTFLNDLERMGIIRVDASSRTVHEVCLTPLGLNVYQLHFKGDMYPLRIQIVLSWWYFGMTVIFLVLLEMMTAMLSNRAFNIYARLAAMYFIITVGYFILRKLFYMERAFYEHREVDFPKMTSLTSMTDRSIRITTFLLNTVIPLAIGLGVAVVTIPVPILLLYGGTDPYFGKAPYPVGLAQPFYWITVFGKTLLFGLLYGGMLIGASFFVNLLNNHVRKAAFMTKSILSDDEASFTDKRVIQSMWLRVFRRTNLYFGLLLVLSFILSILGLIFSMVVYSDKRYLFYQMLGITMLIVPLLFYLLVVALRFFKILDKVEFSNQLTEITENPLINASLLLWIISTVLTLSLPPLSVAAVAVVI